MLKGNFLHRLYFYGICIVLCLPLLSWQPMFAPPDWAKNIVFRSITAILLFAFLWEVLQKKRTVDFKSLVKNKVVWALAGLFCIYFLASIFSADPLFSFWGSPYRGGGFVNFAFYFIFAFLVLMTAKKEDWQKFWNISIVVGCLAALVGILQYLGLIFESAGRPASTVGNPILLGIYLLLLIFVTISFAIKEKIAWKKASYIAAVLLFLFTILITGSRAAWLGLLMGAVYFLFFYPAQNAKNIKIIKVSAACLLIIAALFVAYINTAGHFPKFLEESSLFTEIKTRLSLDLLLIDPRFTAWKEIDIKIVADSPFLGYGLENFSIGFDRHYDPSVPYIDKNWGAWWDRAHNIIFQTASDAGVIAVIIYIALFVALFWQLSRCARSGEARQKITTHAMQATLIGYFVANFFSFDSYSSYVLFFLIIAYNLHINGFQTLQEQTAWRKQKPLLAFVLFCVLAVFLWQYNFVPLATNEKINRAEALSQQKKCSEALGLMDKALQRRSFLDSYARMQYVQIIKICNEFYPENGIAYRQKGIELIKEAVKIQPKYTRYWMFLGEASTFLAKQEQDSETKSSLLKEAEEYLNKALALAPKHQEIFVDLAKMEIVAQNFEKAKEYSQKCAQLNQTIGDCYFYLGLAEIYLNDLQAAQQSILAAAAKLYNTESMESLGELADAYADIQDYKNLVIVFEKIVALEPGNAQYHSTLAFLYSKTKDYKKARDEALKVLELSPESKENVEQFLKTLP